MINVLYEKLFASLQLSITTVNFKQWEKYVPDIHPTPIPSHVSRDTVHGSAGSFSWILCISEECQATK